LSRDLNDRRRELTTVVAAIAHAPEWRRSYDELGRNLKQAERFATPTDVIKKVDEVGAAAGILTKTKRTLKEEEHDVYHEWPVQYNFDTTVESLVKFLHGLQTSSGFMTVEQLDVTTRVDNSGILGVVIQIRALAAKEGKSTP
ncbi:MAG: GspMb/PilO family protein, partial [Verrucomicrobiota bacterium]